ncbi:MAG: hypothetical protein M1814_003081 [Vezdaea aestivalis]|nr:MAG: hypothetical protein M1814_003081 [Vezdaea aestivalis]
MAGRDNPQDSRRDGVRRRQSSRDEDRDSRASTDNVRPASIHISSSTAIDSPTSPTAKPSSRLGFSEDLEPVAHEDDQPTDKHNARKRSPSASPGRSNRGLSIDPHYDLASSVRPIPTSMWGSAAQASPHTTKTVPIRDPSASPTSRHRGYSLRRTIFSRSLAESDTPAGSLIELAEAGPSKQRLSQVQGNGAARSEKTSASASATIVNDSDKLVDQANTIGRKRSGVKHPVLPHYDAWIRKKSDRFKFFRPVKDTFRLARKRILRIRDIVPSKDGRHIILNVSRKKPLTDERMGKAYIANTIRSSRYNLWNFLPRQLVAQFSKLANFYFLCVSILQLIPTLSTTGTYTTIVPLIFFVSLSIAKEGYDDLRRYRLDKVENNKETSILHAYDAIPASESERTSLGPKGLKHWATTKWRDVKVGDVVKLKRDDATPADIVLLNANGPNNIAYIETMALDGETNLKSKQPPPAIAGILDTDEKISACDAHFVVEDPNLDLYNFEGRLEINGETHPLSGNEVIYRGSTLRNTPEAVGMVIYSGEECKIRMNANKNPRIKAPNLQAKTNTIVIIIVIFVILLAIFNTAAYQIWKDEVEEPAWYLDNAAVPFFPILASFIIMFNTMIPLSLYVSLEIIKLAQMFLLRDIDMYDSNSNTPMEARTSTINEDLGQVSYIFSDKTGTLTDNSMQFRKLAIGGLSWLHNPDSKPGLQQPPRQSTTMENPKGKKSAKPKSSHRMSGFSRKDSGFSRRASLAASNPMENSTAQLLRYMQANPDCQYARKARFFLLCVALCHTCLPEPGDDGPIKFQAASPDELALVVAAQDLGYLVIDRQSDSITLRTTPGGDKNNPIIERFEILDVVEFSSKRKRMSIVVRLPESHFHGAGRIVLITKGADSALVPLMRLSKLAIEKSGEIDRRNSQRKSFEAHQLIERRSSHHASRKNSSNRLSLSLGRPSIGAIGRSSLNSNRLQPIRSQLDSWLTEREHDVEIGSAGRLSGPLSPRFSTSRSRPTHTFYATNSSEDPIVTGLIEDALQLNDSSLFEKCFENLIDFATDGLRTLMYGYRFVPEDQYQAWRSTYKNATTSLVDRQSLIENAAAVLERDYELCGATAIEDELQEGVPAAIEKLRRANIKMWMLTGDKRETAINIGHSCRLIKDYSTVTILDIEKGGLERELASAIISIDVGVTAHSVIVVDGQTLAVIAKDITLKTLFFDLAIMVDSVICCRASPSQKAYLVKSVRKKVKSSITLAIGDGANDIAMIQEAHVGIGITGKEGLQAARTSDYSIAQFRFLLKLLLVHGRWNYIRTCKYTVGTFWKEMLFYLTQALYQRWNGYTGTSLYEPWSLSLFNTFFTSLPVIFLGIFEKDLSASTLLAVPELYAKGQKTLGFNFKIYLAWMFTAASEAMIIYFMMFAIYANTLFTRDNGVYSMGVLTYSAVVILISTKLLFLEMHHRSFLSALGAFLSVGGWFLWNIILTFTYHNNVIYNVKGGLLHRFGENALWWLLLIVIFLACLIFELTLRSLKSVYFPTDVDIFQEYEKDSVIRNRFEDASASEMRLSRTVVEPLKWGWPIARRRNEIEEQRARELEVERLLAERRRMEERQALETPSTPVDTVEANRACPS